MVGVEALTSTARERWQSHPATLKALGDQMFCLGANRLQVHRFAMQRFAQIKPGLMMGVWGQQYDRTQTWWDWSKPWHDYLARCQFMLRQGPVVADVLAVVPEEPLYRFEHNPIPGHDYVACGPDLFKRVTVADGKVGLAGGARYPLMIVDHTGTMTLARLRQIRELVANGANLLGEPPQATPGLENRLDADKELKALAAEIWGDPAQTERAYGRGRVFRGIKPAEALARLGVVPDFTGPAKLSWIHRANAALDLYFVASDSDQPIMVTASFRLQGRTAELWDPETGSARPLDTVSTEGGRTTAQVPLGPTGSAFVVFRKGADASPSIASLSRDGEALFPQPLSPGESSGPADSFEFTVAASGERGLLLHRSGSYSIRYAGGEVREWKQVRVPESRLLGGPWTLTLPQDSGVPEPLRLDALDSWSRHPDKNVKHFSGTAVYRTQFTLPEIQSRVVLDLGRVEVMARVLVNGRELGTLWKAPYHIDITEAARAGENTLEVAVVNLWVNRLIGDAALPEDAERDQSGRLTSWPDWMLAGESSPTGRRSFVTVPLWKKDEPLKDSGLLGPVSLRFPVAFSLNGGPAGSRRMAGAARLPEK